jgi:alkanesulfonate monooxygenase SsuD/methylene tetrahydromethanopterin reductase-like flavin-dependent oxidoreductase (luciferase family)
MVGTDVVCDAVEGRFLQAGALAELRAACRTAEDEGFGAVFLSDGPLGDPIVLAAGLAPITTGTLLGVQIALASPTGRHPTLLAREMTSFDHVCGGRSVLAFLPPHDKAVAEAARLCRAMWRHGTARSDGPRYLVPGAVNLPVPPGPDSPRLALDLTDGSTAPPELVELVDFLLMRDDRPGVCRLQPA